MDCEEVTTKFLKYWEKHNNDKFFDAYDVKYSLRIFCKEKLGFEPDFRNKEYRDLWQSVKNEIFKKTVKN